MATSVDTLDAGENFELATANRRIVARWLDLVILGNIGSFLLGFLWVLFGGEISDEFTDSLLFSALLGFFAMMLLDAPCTKIWGRTPGKMLLGLRVISSNEEDISWGRAWKRALLVWVRGLSFGIPLLFLLTSAVAMRKVVKTGLSSWDSSACTKVVRRVPA
ncbi:RDD family protein [Microbulbifer guangxiensis]|uniref:RDD family protein n=1 Tax=Microbulbifer guangxiensis TaxID=2904249 RepID=UPI001F2CAF35|nr:RDD family protein [Microbulbifer guangxiensis]